MKSAKLLYVASQEGLGLGRKTYSKTCHRGRWLHHTTPFFMARVENTTNAAHVIQSDTVPRESTISSTRFANQPADFWREPKHQRDYFQWAASKLGVMTLDDWYGVTSANLSKVGHSSWIQTICNGSFGKALQLSFPEHNWRPWKFHQVPGGYWDDNENVSEFIQHVIGELKIDSLDQWYSVDMTAFGKLGGTSLLLKYDGSPFKMLRSIYPTHPWVAWKFRKVPKRAWQDEVNQRSFCDWMMQEMQIKDMNDWYNITSADFERHGGRGLVKHYGGSPYALILSVYRDHDWSVWKFRRPPATYWRKAKANGDLSQVIKLVEHVKAKAGFIEDSDWYRLSTQEFGSLHLNGLVKAFGGIAEVLNRVYPNHRWEESKFSLKSKKAKQWKLRATLAEIFPGEDIQEEVVWRDLKAEREFRFDVFLPTRSIAFEYDGEQHMKDTAHAGQQHHINENDATKTAECTHAGITLIRVPHWWPGDLGSLANTIRHYRPDDVPSWVPRGDGIAAKPK